MGAQGNKLSGGTAVWAGFLEKVAFGREGEEGPGSWGGGRVQAARTGPGPEAGDAAGAVEAAGGRKADSEVGREAGETAHWERSSFLCGEPGASPGVTIDHVSANS